MSFLNSLENKVKQGKDKYVPPAEDYDFLKDEHEVMINESDLDLDGDDYNSEEADVEMMESAEGEEGEVEDEEMA